MGRRWCLPEQREVDRSLVGSVTHLQFGRQVSRGNAFDRMKRRATRQPEADQAQPGEQRSSRGALHRDSVLCPRTLTENRPYHDVIVHKNMSCMRGYDPSRSEFRREIACGPAADFRHNSSAWQEVAARQVSSAQQLDSRGRFKEVKSRDAIRQEMQGQRELQGHPGREFATTPPFVMAISSAIAPPCVIELPHVQTSMRLNRDTPPCWPRSNPA